jgi:hypothetical protein
MKLAWQEGFRRLWFACSAVWLVLGVAVWFMSLYFGISAVVRDGEIIKVWRQCIEAPPKPAPTTYLNEEGEEIYLNKQGEPIDPLDWRQSPSLSATSPPVCVQWQVDSERLSIKGQARMANYYSGGAGFATPANIDSETREAIGFVLGETAVYFVALVLGPIALAYGLLRVCAWIVTGFRAKQ